MKLPHHHQLRVAEVIVETSDARSFVLAVPDELAERFAYRAGQFLTVRVPRPDGGFAARCYSLSSAPNSRQLTITVKRIADGHGSNWLCDNVAVGSELQVLPPAGTFTPRTLDADFLLFAAGSGITPVMSIVRAALATGSGEVVLVYANRDENSIIFGAELDRLTAAHADRLTIVHWLETGPHGRGLPTAAGLREVAAPHADHEVYVCGPELFMIEALQAAKLLGVPHNRTHVERFVSLADDPFAVSAEVAPADAAEAEDPAAQSSLEVELDGEEHRLPWPAGARMLDVLLDHGLAAPFSCRQALCGACTCRLEKGEVNMIENNVLDAEDLADGYILACQALPVSNTVRISYE
ncbi:MAG TPA: ferredoxin--NADP reductase [Kineosporiaceae bacterium]|nr:ferredoxin--NADP reductase [Kineosporiaceae bacterium]